ncbi:hypothetical protein GGH94_004342 [Coemansia aciculifera]|uniref:Uncharacterized protein n=1 Tax=Coemansia aciculifera TaxID=417176 RepID=A0A9W8M467_9FUNG|nr:hypothetical protein GGH94_004342 [Coemansia aciculifera]KAJ2871828.1 hypothetical protein GGH93_004520 [Coemansia aciculifera]
MQQDGVYNYVLMTVPALLHSADESWFEPLPMDEQSEDIIEDTWGDLNKKSLLK